MSVEVQCLEFSLVARDRAWGVGKCLGVARGRLLWQSHVPVPFLYPPVSRFGCAMLTLGLRAMFRQQVGSQRCQGSAIYGSAIYGSAMHPTPSPVTPSPVTNGFRFRLSLLLSVSLFFCIQRGLACERACARECVSAHASKEEAQKWGCT